MQPAVPARPDVFRFGVFELDESARELRRSGLLVHLPPQPFQILTLLVQNAGEVVDRNRIRQEVWPDTTVDFDRSLNVAIAQVRAALNDSAESPRFIQTVPRKGYRFLAEVSRGIEVPLPAIPPDRRRRRVVEAALVLLLSSLIAAAVFRPWQHGDSPVRLAVLPFENLSLGGSEAAESDGIFDDLLTRLGGVQPSRLQIIGRRSVSYLNRHGAGTLAEIGRRLNVGYAVESTVRRDGASLRVAVRLVQTGNEAVIWSGAYVQDESAQAFQESVVARVSAGVLATLFPGTSPQPAESACRDGWESFQAGRLLANRGGRADLERSLDFFRKAACAPAGAQMAEVLVRLERMGAGPSDGWETARRAAQAAVRADPGLAGAHLALGNVAFWHDWNWASARREYGEALRLNPSNPDAHHDLAWLQVATGSRTEALSSIDTAIALDPLSPRTRVDSGWLLLQTGRFSRAAAEARQTLALDSGMREALACLSRALLYDGDTKGAIDAMRPLLPPASAAELAGLPPARAARRLMELGLESTGQSSYERAWRLAWLGSRDQAVAALEDAFRAHSMMMPLTAVDPGFVAIREEPRFRAIVRQLGLGH